MQEYILQIFREEASERLASLEQRFLDLESTESAHERVSIIDELFRHAHSLKGGARSVGLHELQQEAQQYQQQQQARRQITELLTAAADWDLPQDLLKRQSMRELERSVMELRRSGFTDELLRRWWRKPWLRARFSAFFGRLD